MNAPSRIDMLEATRLTREGRLADAMAVLQGRGTTNAASAPGTSSRRDCDGPSGRPSPVIEATFERLRTQSAGAAPSKTTAAAPKAARLRGRFETHRYADANGSRDYKLYSPGHLGSEPVPLIVMLHGCTQSPDDFAAGTRMNELAERHGLLVAYPAQSRAANASGCWNWFKPSDQRRDGGEPALIAGIAREIVATLPVDPARVYVAGLSAGGAAAAIMGARYRDIFAAFGVHSGLSCGAARDMPSAFAAMKTGAAGGATPGSGTPIPTIVFHGDRDTTVHPLNGDHVIAQSGAGAAFDTVTREGRSAGGTRFTTTVHRTPEGLPVLEQWVLKGVGHAWSGGSASGSYTHPDGPDASAEMLRFFLDHQNHHPAARR